MENVASVNDLIEGVVLDAPANSLAPASIPKSESPKKAPPMVIKPTENKNGETQYNVFEGSSSVDTKSAPKETFSNYDGESKYSDYKSDASMTTQFYIGSLTIVGLYIFYKLIQRSR